MVTKSSDLTALKVGSALNEGAHIVTQAGGYITFTLADGSVITLNPDSNLQVKKLQKYATGVRDTELKIDSSSLDVQAKPQGDAGRFQITTPVAIKVAVSGGATAIVVANGYGTIGDTAGPGPVIKFLPLPDLSAIPSKMTAVAHGFYRCTWT